MRVTVDSLIRPLTGGFGLGPFRVVSITAIDGRSREIRFALNNPMNPFDTGNLLEHEVEIITNYDNPICYPKGEGL